MAVLAHHLAGVHLFLREDEEAAAVLQLVNGVGERRAGLHRYHRTVRAPLNLSLIGLILLEAVRHNGLARAGGQHVGAQADDAARRHVELQVDAVPAGGLHLLHLALAARDHVDDFARIFLGHVDGQLLDRFAAHAVYLLENDLRLPHLQFVALAAHGFDEDGEVQHASARDHPLAVFLALAHAQRQVLVELLHQPVLNVARGDVLALAAEEGRVVYCEQHAHGRLVYGDGGQRLRVVVVAHGVANLESLDAHQRADVAGRDFGHALAAHALEGVQFLDFGLQDGAVTLGQGYVHALAQRASVHAPHGDAARIR